MIFNQTGAGGGGGIKLASIAITTAPTKTAYNALETFDTTGMVVTATYTNGATLAVGGYTVNPQVMTIGTTSVTITYTEGGVSKAATQAVTVTKNLAPVPTVSGTLTYNGSSQSPTINNEPSTAIATRGGDADGTNAGNYTKTYTLVDTVNYEWATTFDGNLAWSIGKATPTLTLSPTSVTLNTSTTSQSVSITYDGDGTLSAESDNTSVATVSPASPTNSITINSVNSTSGSATITVSASAGTNYVAASETVSVTAAFIPSDVNDAGWAQISEVSQAGTGDAYWDVGDTKAITLNGTIGTKSYSKETLYVFILMFNCPTNKTTADNNIIWGGFKTALTGGVDVGLDDANYNTTPTSGTISFNMNHTYQTSSSGAAGYYGTNYGGWKGTDLRYDILGTAGTPPSQYNQNKSTSNVGYDATTAAIISPKSNTLMAALPNGLRAALRLWTRWVDNVGNDSNVDANVTSCVDAGISLLAEFEVHGTRSYANQYEQNHQVQMTYYANGNSKIKYRQSSSGTAAVWWVASPYYSAKHSFCFVDEGGGAANGIANYYRAVAPAFKT